MDARSQTRGFRRTGGTLAANSVGGRITAAAAAGGAFEVAWTAAWLWRWRARYWRIFARIAGDSSGCGRVHPDSVESSSLLPWSENSFVIAAAGYQRYRRDSAHQPGPRALPEAVVDEFRRTTTHIQILNTIWRGARGKRDVHTAELLTRLTGAESPSSSTIAPQLSCHSCGTGTRRRSNRSRGELIEIGAGFRIPEIMEQSGALLREVGTTNRTQLADYENAINEKTRLLLRVHPSNFKVTGFTDKPSLEDLVALSQRSGLPLAEDLGSGCLVDLCEHGIQEPTVRQSVETGVGIVTFSGDKLLGGPQAGIIAGKKELIASVRRHPLFRALRVDKLTIAALEVTLGAYLRAAWDEIPAMRMIRMTPQELKRRAENFLRELRPELPLDEVDEIAAALRWRGGSTPSVAVSKVIRIASARYSATKLDSAFRRAPAGVSVIARVEDDRLILTCEPCP
jgi:L-seryl-tRNA(Ser) seleniumtransferase